MSWSQGHKSPLALLLLARLISLLCLIAGVALTGLSGLIQWPVGELAFLFSAIGLLCLVAFTRVQQNRPLGRWELFAQITGDLVFFSVFLYYTGGQSNPFIMLLMPLVAVASMVLVWRQLMLFIGLAVLLVAWVSVFNLPMRLAYPDMARNLHLIGMAINFLVTLAVIAGFVGWLSHSLRNQQAALQKATRQHVKQQARSEFGLRSAAVLHELGGPVSMFKISLEDWQDECKANGQVCLQHEDLNLLQSGLNRMDQALQKQSRWVRELDDHKPTGSPVGLNTQPLTEVVDSWVKDWSNQHSSTHLQVSGANELIHYRINTEQAATLHTVLLTLLDNAQQAIAELGENSIQVRFDGDSDRMTFEVVNKTALLDKNYFNILGKQPVDSKSTGIGLFLAKQLCDDFGAELQLSLGPAKGVASGAKLQEFIARVIWNFNRV